LEDSPILARENHSMYAQILRANVFSHLAHFRGASREASGSETEASKHQAELLPKEKPMVAPADAPRPSAEYRSLAQN